MRVEAETPTLTVNLEVTVDGPLVLVGPHGSGKSLAAAGIARSLCSYHHPRYTSVSGEAERLSELALCTWLGVERIALPLMGLGAPNWLLEASGYSRLVEVFGHVVSSESIYGSRPLAEAVDTVEQIIARAASAAGAEPGEASRWLPYRFELRLRRVERAGSSVFEATPALRIMPGGVEVELRDGGHGSSASIVLTAAALHLAVARVSGKRTLLLVEDPEACLSVEAQFTLGYLLGALPRWGVHTVATTKSEAVLAGVLAGAAEYSPWRPRVLVMSGGCASEWWWDSPLPVMGSSARFLVAARRSRRRWPPRLEAATE